MFLFAGLHAAVTYWADGPRVGWPAIVAVLFLVLGWNFIDLGVDPPQDDGTSVGWLVSGVVFWLMALGFLAPAAMRAVGAAVPGAPPAAAPPRADVPARLVLPPRGPDDPGGAR